MIENLPISILNQPDQQVQQKKPGTDRFLVPAGPLIPAPPAEILDNRPPVAAEFSADYGAKSDHRNNPEWNTQVEAAMVNIRGKNLDEFADCFKEFDSTDPDSFFVTSPEEEAFHKLIEEANQHTTELRRETRRQIIAEIKERNKTQPRLSRERIRGNARINEEIRQRMAADERTQTFAVEKSVYQNALKEIKGRRIKAQAKWIMENDPAFSPSQAESVTPASLKQALVEADKAIASVDGQIKSIESAARKEIITSKPEPDNEAVLQLLKDKLEYNLHYQDLREAHGRWQKVRAEIESRRKATARKKFESAAHATNLARHQDKMAEELGLREYFRNRNALDTPKIEQKRQALLAETQFEQAIYRDLTTRVGTRLSEKQILEVARKTASKFRKTGVAEVGTLTLSRLKELRRQAIQSVQQLAQEKRAREDQEAANRLLQIIEAERSLTRDNIREKLHRFFGETTRDPNRIKKIMTNLLTSRRLKQISVTALASLAGSQAIGPATNRNIASPPPAIPAESAAQIANTIYEEIQTEHPQAVDQTNLNIASEPQTIPAENTVQTDTNSIPKKKIEANKPLVPEIPMPAYKFSRIVNAPPQEISAEKIGQPPDLGTAYQLALWGDPHWRDVFIQNYLGSNNQSSVQMRWNDTEGKPTPPIWSWGDYIYLSQRQVPNQQYIINVDPTSGKPTFEQVVFQNNIKLPDGKTINGIKIFDHKARGVGMLEKLWFTTSPNHKRGLFGEMIGVHGPNVLAEVIDKIYIVVDGKTVKSYDPITLFSGKDPTLGRYENGGFLFSPLLSYENAQIYLTSSAFQGNANRYQGSERHGDLFDQLYYRVIAQDFGKNVTSTVPNLETGSKARTEFFGAYQQFQNSVNKEEFPQKERVLVENSWTKTIEDSGFSKFSFRAASSQDLVNTRLSIKYPEPGIPEVNISLSELIGTDNFKFSLANRFISVTNGENGGIKVDFNQSIPLPEGTQITLSANKNAKTEVLWQHREDQIGKARFGVIHQRLERNQSNGGKQEFTPVSKDFAVNQIIAYIDDPAVDIDQYNQDNTRFGLGNNYGQFPWNEGNFYFQEADGTLIPLSNGLEELGDSAFYAGDAEGKTGFVPAEKAAGDTHKMYYYGKGHYNFIFSSDNKLVRVDKVDPDNMYSLGFMNSMIKMRKKGPELWLCLALQHLKPPELLSLYSGITMLHRNKN